MGIKLGGPGERSAASPAGISHHHFYDVKLTGPQPSVSGLQITLYFTVWSDPSFLNRLWCFLPSGESGVMYNLKFVEPWAFLPIALTIAWQSYPSKESLTWGKSLKCFLKWNVTPAWGHRQANVIARFEPGVVPQWDTEKQKYRRDSGTLWEAGEEEEEEVCRSCSFRVLILSLLSVLAPIMISSDMI